MKKKKWKNNDDVFMNTLRDFKVKCPCGHVLIMVSRPFIICSWCGRKVYRSKKDEFEDKMKKLIK